MTTEEQIVHVVVETYKDDNSVSLVSKLSDAKDRATKFSEENDGELVYGWGVEIFENQEVLSPPKYVIGQHVLESGVTSDPYEYILVSRIGDGNYWKVEIFSQYQVLHEDDFRPMTGGEEDAYREEQIEKIVQSWIDANMQDCSILASIIKYGVKGLENMTKEELDTELRHITK